MLNGKLAEMLDNMMVHLATADTQVDIKEEVEDIIAK